ncbi:RNA polymerase subunit sigma-70 [Sphingopyxis sp. QXT-31]|uniref:sigma factor n=1 Tax=Sphingopyxis sp. QXT-31 TaxID=1357916 RepID=UPI0009797607|nr:sigma factor [Sphingopyxis sp. QXT-31]APZ99990.1 RNA polymerase subunit sigma-70 [Sphingopyxis sp. QXT-31]
MSAKSDALEQAVMDWIAARTASDAEPTPRRRAQADRAFARLAACAAPRIRYFIRRYGLSSAYEDGEQACAIALHRAAQSYDPRRAAFTTHMNWQIRAELQALRHRLHGDQRRAPHRLAAETLSLGDPAILDRLVDPDAELAVEGRASDYLAGRLADRLADDWAQRRDGEWQRGKAKLAAQHSLVRRHLTAVDPAGRLSESHRHIVRRAFADIALRIDA